MSTYGSNHSPVNGATVTTTSPTLSWSWSIAWDSFDIFWGTDQATIASKGYGDSYGEPGSMRVGGLSWAISGLTQGSTYYWKITAIKNSTEYNDEPVKSFTVQCQPSTPSLSSPANAATNQSLSPTLSWGASGYATSYDVYVGTDNPPTNILNGVNQAGISKSLSGLSADTEYFWKIVAKNAYGTATSAIRSFTTVAEPTKAATPDPADEATDVDRAKVLGWIDGGAGGSGPAASYNVYFGTDSTPDSSEYQGNQSGTSFNPGTLKAVTAYYWRIDSVNAAGTATGDVWSFTTAEITSGTPADRKYKRRLAAAANNKFWYENDDVPAQMIELAGLTLDTTKPLSMFEAYQKIFIANEANLKVVDFVNTILGYSTGLTAPPAHGDILTQAVTGASMVVDFVSSDRKKIYGFVTTSEDFDTTNNVGGSPSDTLDPDPFVPASVTSPATPHYYDWTPYPDLDGGSANQFGSLPDKATIACLYRGRCFLSGNPDYPHQWYMSRQANPWDWQYFANDAQSAVAGNDANVGEVGDIVTAAGAYSDDYMVIGGQMSIWVLRGDPAEGGSLDQIGFTTGIWDKNAWCRDSSNNIYFLGSNGIYMIPAGLGQPVDLTKDTIPDFMNDWGLDNSLHRVTMCYDQTRHGLIICKTTLDGGANESYWYDLRVGDQNHPGGFFPEKYPDECGVYANHFYKADDPKYRKSLLGCTDGYIRVFDDDTKDDDIGSSVTAVESDVLLGPIPISANSGLAAVTNSQTFVTAGGGAGGSQADTDAITYQIFVADTAEEIIEQVTADTPDPMFSGTITGPGKARRKRHRARGVFAGIRILNITANQTWAIDRVLLDVKQAGRLK